jgi:hypothetical protein
MRSSSPSSRTIRWRTRTPSIGEWRSRASTSKAAGSASATCPRRGPRVAQQPAARGPRAELAHTGHVSGPRAERHRAILHAPRVAALAAGARRRRPGGRPRARGLHPEPRCLRRRRHGDPGAPGRGAGQDHGPSGARLVLLFVPRSKEVEDPAMPAYYDAAPAAFRAQAIPFVDLRRRLAARRGGLRLPAQRPAPLRRGKRDRRGGAARLPREAPAPRAIERGPGPTLLGRALTLRVTPADATAITPRPRPEPQPRWTRGP